MADIIKKHKEVPHDDMLQIMIDHKDTEGTGDGLTEENVSNHAQLFLNAGSETTANVILYLFIHIKSMAFFLIKMCEEIKYHDLLIEELRTITSGSEGLLSYDQVKDLKWFDAILKETMRVDPVASGIHFGVVINQRITVSCRSSRLLC